jgi:hypothetical protein
MFLLLFLRNFDSSPELLHHVFKLVIYLRHLSKDQAYSLFSDFFHLFVKLLNTQNFILRLFCAISQMREVLLIVKLIGPYFLTLNLELVT